jgi:hypothetical protein
MALPQMFGQGTWLDNESYAYNTPTGSAHGSGRRARAMCADGVLRTFRVGVPDTFFSIPAVGKIKGRYAVGFVMVDADVLTFHERKREES